MCILIRKSKISMKEKQRKVLRIYSIKRQQEKLEFLKIQSKISLITIINSLSQN